MHANIKKNTLAIIQNKYPETHKHTHTCTIKRGSTYLRHMRGASLGLEPKSYTNTPTNIHTYTHTFSLTYTNIHTHTYIHAYIHTIFRGPTNFSQMTEAKVCLEP